MTNVYLSTFQDIEAGRKIDLAVLKKALKFRIPDWLEDEGNGDYRCPECGKICLNKDMNFLVDFCPFCGKAVRI